MPFIQSLTRNFVLITAFLLVWGSGVGALAEGSVEDGMSTVSLDDENDVHVVRVGTGEGATLKGPSLIVPVVENVTYEWESIYHAEDLGLDQTGVLTRILFLTNGEIDAQSLDALTLSLRAADEAMLTDGPIDVESYTEVIAGDEMELVEENGEQGVLVELDSGFVLDEDEHLGIYTQQTQFPSTPSLIGYQFTETADPQTKRVDTDRIPPGDPVTTREQPDATFTFALDAPAEAELDGPDEVTAGTFEAYTGTLVDEDGEPAEAAEETTFELETEATSGTAQFYEEEGDPDANQTETVTLDAGASEVTFWYRPTEATDAPYALTVRSTAGEPVGEAEEMVTVVHADAEGVLLDGSSDPLSVGDERDFTTVITDAFGNPVVTGDESELDVTLEQEAGDGAVSGLGTESADAGAATFTVNGAEVGSVELRADASPLSYGSNERSFEVVAGTPDRDQITADVPATGLVDEPTEVVVTVADAGGNPVGDVADDFAFSVEEGPNADGGFSDVSEPERGTYVTTYTPSEAGTDEIAIVFDDTPLEGSPFSTEVQVPPQLVAPADGANATLEDLEFEWSTAQMHDESVSYTLIIERDDGEGGEWSVQEDTHYRPATAKSGDAEALLASGHTYEWWVEATTAAKTIQSPERFTFTAAGDAPDAFILESSYPNPFNESTTITYGVPTRAEVQVDIVDVQGRHVERLVDRSSLAPGTYEVEWHPRGATSGTYLYRMVAEGIDGTRFVKSHTMTLIR